VTSGVPLPYLTSQSPFVINAGNNLYSYLGTRPGVENPSTLAQISSNNLYYNLGLRPINPGLGPYPLLNPYGFGPYANPYNLAPFTNPLANPFAVNPFTTPYNPLWGVPGLTTASPLYTNPLACFYYPSPNGTPFLGPYPYSNPFASPFNNLFPGPYANLYPQLAYPGWPFYGPSPALTMYPNYPPNLYPQTVNPWLMRPGIGYPAFGGLGSSSFGGVQSGYGPFGAALPVGYSPLSGFGF
jgi:hypothetical protein